MAEMRVKQDKVEQLTTTLMAAAKPFNQEFELPDQSFKGKEEFNTHELLLMRNESYKKYFLSIYLIFILIY